MKNKTHSDSSVRSNFGSVILAFSLLSMLYFTACQREKIEDELMTEAPLPNSTLTPADIVCGSVESASFISSTGSRYIDHCSSGPCQTTLPWGRFNYFKGVDANWTNPRIEGEFQLAASWFATSSDFCVERQGGMQFQNGLPIVTASCQSATYGTFISRANVLFPLPSSWLPYDCYEICLRVGVQRLNLFSQTLSGSERNLFATIQPDPPVFFIEKCFDRCIPETTTQTQGDCRNCHAEITVTYTGCESVDVTSCKHINFVDVIYNDCTRERFTNPSGTLPAPGGNGKTISHVFVKSGCNVSHLGPGYGTRFDGPCRNVSCAAMN